MMKTLNDYMAENYLYVKNNPKAEQMAHRLFNRPGCKIGGH